MIPAGKFKELYRVEDREINYSLQNGVKLACQTQVLIRKRDRSRSGVSALQLREISFLKMLSHPNVLSILDTVSDNAFTYTIYEHADVSLANVLKQSPLIPSSIVQNLVFQILCGLHYIHTRGILHRFLSPHAILLRFNGENSSDMHPLQDCQVKIGDFLFARTNTLYSLPGEDADYTAMNCNFGYQSVEQLLGGECDGRMDVWAVGCLLLELGGGEEWIFPSLCGYENLIAIFSQLGTPTPSSHPSLCSLPNYSPLFPQLPAHSLRTCSYVRRHEKALLGRLGAVGLDLAQNMLNYTATLRPTPYDCIQHAYFRQLRQQVLAQQSTPADLVRLCADDTDTSSDVHMPIGIPTSSSRQDDGADRKDRQERLREVKAQLFADP
eukprot:gene25606-30925_t